MKFRLFRIRRHADAESGQAMLEFILAFPPVLVLLLMIIEFAHYANVNQFAQYAAFAAARARLVADDSAAAQAAALAMVPYADSGSLTSISADAAAASKRSDVASKWSTLSQHGYKRTPAITGSNNRINNSFGWQTDTWIKLYKGNDQSASQSDFTYVKSGVCFTYPLRIQSLAVLTAFIMRLQDRTSTDTSPSSLFGGSADPLAPTAPKNYWTRCDTIRQQSGLYVVPVIKGCLLGKR